MLSDFLTAKILFIIEDNFLNYKKYEENFKTKSVGKYDF